MENRSRRSVSPLRRELHIKRFTFVGKRTCWWMRLGFCLSRSDNPGMSPESIRLTARRKIGSSIRSWCGRARFPLRPGFSIWCLRWPQLANPYSRAMASCTSRRARWVEKIFWSVSRRRFGWNSRRRCALLGSLRACWRRKSFAWCLRWSRLGFAGSGFVGTENFLSFTRGPHKDGLKVSSVELSNCWVDFCPFRGPDAPHELDPAYSENRCEGKNLC